MNKIILYCFPYAGGSSVIYSKWKQYLNTEIELRPIELAGRGKRFSAPLYEDIQDAVEDVFNTIKDEIQENQYILFGHSMGGLIAYELAQHIRKSNIPNPSHVFVSGRSAPHVAPPNKNKYSQMDSDKFIKEVLNLGGTPPEFFEHPELLELFLPILKNDFRIVETYKCNNQVQPLEVNISVLLGKEDDLTKNQSDSWKEYTNQKCDIIHFEGGHFFINDKTIKIAKIINNVSSSIRKESNGFV
jgi:surfactin synthase thioesterase subunit